MSQLALLQQLAAQTSSSSAASAAEASSQPPVGSTSIPPNFYPSPQHLTHSNGLPPPPSSDLPNDSNSQRYTQRPDGDPRHRDGDAVRRARRSRSPTDQWDTYRSNRPPRRDDWRNRRSQSPSAGPPSLRDRPMGRTSRWGESNDDDGYPRRRGDWQEGGQPQRHGQAQGEERSRPDRREDRDFEDQRPRRGMGGEGGDRWDSRLPRRGSNGYARDDQDQQRDEFQRNTRRDRHPAEPRRIATFTSDDYEDRNESRRRNNRRGDRDAGEWGDSERFTDTSWAVNVVGGNVKGGQDQTGERFQSVSTTTTASKAPQAGGSGTAAAASDFDPDNFDPQDPSSWTKFAAAYEDKFGYQPTNAELFGIIMQRMMASQMAAAAAAQGQHGQGPGQGQMHDTMGNNPTAGNVGSMTSAMNTPMAQQQQQQQHQTGLQPKAPSYANDRRLSAQDSFEVKTSQPAASASSTGTGWGPGNAEQGEGEADMDTTNDDW